MILLGRQPQKKTTSYKDNLVGRRPYRKVITQEVTNCQKFNII